MLRDSGLKAVADRHRKAIEIRGCFGLGGSRKGPRDELFGRDLVGGRDGQPSGGSDYL